MSSSNFVSQFFKRRTWSAIAAGIGASLVTTADAGATLATPDLSDHTVVIKLIEGQLYVSEQERTFVPLALKDTEEARELKKLVDQLGSAETTVVIPVDRLIVADGGLSTSSSRSEQARRRNRSGGSP